MQVAGLVLEFDPDQGIAASSVALLQLQSHITLGKAVENRLPLVMETENTSACLHWHDWLASLNGVQTVHVVYVGFDDESEQQELEACNVA